MKDLIARLTSRKFLLAVIAAATAYGVAMQDNTITQAEIWTILTPILAFIGVEGAADAVTRSTNIPEISDEPVAESPVRSTKKSA
ncbi:MAG: hypothetical protein M3362_00340 [Acidobacteriota bacterium]|nr:hypothetical protein [Acidobacteriota bacterium]